MGKSLLFGLCAAALVGAPAFAADLPYKAPPAPPVPVFSWTGFYLGANIGGAWSNGSVTDVVTGASLNAEGSGFIGGGQAGFNYQLNNFVFGVEWDIDGTTISKNSNVVATAFGNLQASANTDWISTLTGRIGFAADRWLFYVKGGGAWVQNSATLSNLTTGASVSASKTNSGWTAGLGAEWAFSGPWSAKIEYDHVELDNWTTSTATIIAGDQLSINRHIDMVKAGVNYRFGWGGGY
jgi:outer membrane immunogenic protein